MDHLIKAFHASVNFRDTLIDIVDMDRVGRIDEVDFEAVHADLEANVEIMRSALAALRRPPSTTGA